MLTSAQFTGARFVLATFQVTACCVPAVQLTAVPGAVTVNGPAAAETFTVRKAKLTPPPPALLSRAVSRNVIVRVVVGSDSPNVVVPFRMSLRRGNVRVD